MEGERTIVPSARAVDLTMNRDRIRDRAAEIGLPTAKYGYAENLEQMLSLYEGMGSKVVVKPVMSSSGKGQSTVESSDIKAAQEAWHYAVENMRGDRPKVIVEEFIAFDYEITLLTIRQRGADTVYCPVLKHQQIDGDFKISEQGLFRYGRARRKSAIHGQGHDR